MVRRWAGIVRIKRYWPFYRNYLSGRLEATGWAYGWRYREAVQLDAAAIHDSTKH